MPITLTRSRDTGAIFWNHTCEACGQPAAFGVDCFPRAGLDLILAGERERGYRKLGRWYCGEHRPPSPHQPAPQQQPQQQQTSLF